MESKTRRGFINWDMVKIIVALAWPTVVEQAMQTAVQYIDTAMVGAIGTHATAAVGATTTVNWLISGSIGALGIGFLAFIAKAYGAGDEAMKAYEHFRKEFGKYELEFDKFFDHSMMHSAFAMRIFRINEVAIPGAN